MGDQVKYATWSVEDAKQEMDKTWADLQKQMEQINALKDACDRSHRCWPSRFGWGLAAFLAAYLIFMHSWHGDSHSKIERDLKAVMQNTVDIKNDLEMAKTRLKLLEYKSWWKRWVKK